MPGLGRRVTCLDVYEMSLQRRDGDSEFVGFGSLESNTDQDITRVQIFVDGVGFDFEDVSGDFFINSMAVIPEPSGALPGLAG